MPAGTLLHLPEPGGALEQDDFLLERVWLAWRVWYVTAYMSARGLSPSEEDRAFMESILEGYTPAASVYSVDKDLVRQIQAEQGAGR